MAITQDGFKLEVAFASTPFDSAPSWTDITAYWVMKQPTSITHGRGSEQDAVQTGTLSLTLDNTDGRFTLGNTSSAYYPNVKLRKQIRVTYREQTATRTNLVVNPSFETNTTSWSAAGGASIARDTSKFYVGTACLKLTHATAGANTSIAQITVGGLTIGLTYTLQAQVFIPAGLPDHTLRVVGIGGSSNITTRDAWAQASFTFTATATSHVCYLGASSGTTAGQIVYLDAVMVEQASSAGSYFDGDSVDGTNSYDYAWTGTAHGSTSTATPTVYPIFKGYVDEWPVEWPDGGELYAWAQVQASDRFKVLGRRTLRSVVQEEVLEPGAYQYYPLSEPEGSVSAGDIAGTSGNELLTISQIGAGGTGTIAFGTGTGPPTDGATATIFTPADQDNGKFLTGAVANPGGGTAGRSLIAVIRTTATPSATSVNVATAYSASSGYLGLAVDTAGNLKGFISNGTSTANIIGTTVNDGSTHFVAATVLSNGNFILYVDGVNVVSTAWTHTISQTSSLDVAGYSGNAGGFFRGGLFTGTISHVAYFNSELDATTVARLQTAFTTAFANESTGSRAGRVADWAGVATGDRSIDTGVAASIRHVDTTGKSAQGFLQELADTEGGLVFMDASGDLVFQDRGTRINTTAALTLAASSQQVSVDVKYRANDQFVINDVTYTRDGGVTFRAVDATSVTDNGALGPGTVETYTTDDDQVRDQATWVVYTSKTPTARIESLGVDMLTDSASRIAAVQLDLSSKVTVTGMPGAAPGSSTSVFVEGYTETISDSEWTRVLNTSPADLFSPLWQLGVAGYSELGGTTRLNF